MIIIYIQMGGSKKMQQVRSIANRPQGGGNKKQGLPPTGGRPGWLSNFISTNAGGYFRGIPPAGPVDPCPTKEVTVNYDVDSQTAADALRGVTKITGYLNITGNITDWSPFDCLKHITGNVYIENNSLKTISGFGRLTTIGGYFNIIFNNSLKTISGFGRLTTVGVFFSISNNPALTSITGFGSLTTVGGYFEIYNHNNLTEISGFDRLTTVGDYFEISSNDVLETISGFGSLTEVKDDFGIFDNVKLTDASSLWNVVSVGGNFNCYGNTEFTKAAFADLVASLTTIQGNINVNNNSGTDWTLPDVWTTEPKLKWGATTGGRELNDATDPGILGNFSVAAGDELFDLPDKNGIVP